MIAQILDIYLPKADFKLFKMETYGIQNSRIDKYSLDIKNYRFKNRVLYTKYFGISIEYEGYFWKRFKYKKQHYPNIFNEKCWTFQFLGFTITFQTMLEREEEFYTYDFDFN